MEDWIDKLTEVRRLQKTGAIDASEFETRRAAIFAERDAARPPRAPPPLEPDDNTAPAAALPAAVGATAQEPPAPDEPTVPLFKPSDPPAAVPSAGPRLDRRLLIMLGGVAALAVLVVGAGVFLTRKPAAASGGQVQTLYVNRLLHLRSAPTGIDSTVLGDLHRGDTVTGVVITGSDGVTRWLKISGTGGADRFAWARNLSKTPRPPLSSNSEADLSFANQATVMAEPSSAGPAIETEAAGTRVHEAGEVGDWYEIELTRGGVGYVLKSSVQPTPSPVLGGAIQRNTGGVGNARIETLQRATGPSPPPPPDRSAISASAAAAQATAAAADAQAAASQAQAAAQTAPKPPIAQASAPASGVTRYACAFSTRQSVNPPAGTGGLSFVVDEARSCVNNRSIYLRNSAGGLKRTMLNDKEHRASVLYFSPDRGTFIRMDYDLTADAYAGLQQNSAALAATTCAPPGDTGAANRMSLIRATPRVDFRSLPGTTWRRMVWRCSAAG